MTDESNWATGAGATSRATTCLRTGGRWGCVDSGHEKSKGQSFFIEGEPTTRRNQAGWMDGWMAHEGQEASKQTANVGSHLARRDGLGPLRDASRSVRPAAHERARKQDWVGRARKQAAGRADTA